MHICLFECTPVSPHTPQHPVFPAALLTTSLHLCPVSHVSLSVLFLPIFLLTPSLHFSASPRLWSSQRLLKTQAGACQKCIHSWDDHLCFNQTSLSDL